MELFKAHDQWAKRPADETFSSVQEMHAACAAYRAASVEAPNVPISTLRVEARDGTDLYLIGKKETPARMTNWAFGQLAQRAQAPAAYLRSLPPTLAAQNVNYGLKTHMHPDAQANILMHRNGDMVIRAMTSERYDRIWNSEITERVLDLVDRQPCWTLPLAYKRTDHGISNEMVPRGAYASDRDMFVFLVDHTRSVEVPGQEPLRRGFFLWNSEVGDKTFGGQFFLHDRVCGNHIVWGAQQITEFKVKHIGDASQRGFAKMRVELTRYADSASGELEASIVKARSYQLGANKDQVLDAVLKLIDLPRKTVSEAYDVAERTPRYGSPRTAWAMVNGLTELSQEHKHTDARTKIDRDAGKILEKIDF